MKFTEITFHKLFNTQNYENERYEIKVQLEDGDTIKEAFKSAKIHVQQAFQDNNPQLIGDGKLVDGATVDWKPNYDFTTTPIQSVDYKAKERLEKLIDDAGSVDELNSYYQDAHKYNVYDQWLKQLSILTSKPTTTIQ